MHSIGYGVTDIGQVRSENEEAFLVDDELGLYVVSDGMGGHAAGHVASSTAVEAVARYVRDRREELEQQKIEQDNATVLPRIVSNAIQEASDVVYRLATSSPGKAGMGCTLTVLLVAGKKACMGHVGDSRLYLKRSSDVHLLSSDHTYAAELVRMGAISAEETQSSRFKNVLSRSVGTQKAVSPDVLVFDILPGDCLLLCSDGLSDYVSDPTVDLRLLGADDPDVAAEQLVAFANKAGGKDDITVVVVAIKQGDEDAEVMLQFARNLHLKLSVLQKVFLFESLALSQLQRVLNITRVETYEPEAVVVADGETWSSLCVLLNGELSVSRGQETPKQLHPSATFGATTLLRSRPARATLTATKSSRLLRIDSEPFLRLARTRPWLGVELLRQLGVRLSIDLDRATRAAGLQDTGYTHGEASGLF